MTLEEVLALPIHPAAAVFPMLPDDELDELAEDIKAHGLQQPIVVKEVQLGDDPEPYTYLIDGRNRREACKRAGVAPKVVELNGTDPIAFVISSNVNRRHMSVGQRAVALAKVWECQEGGRGKLSHMRESLGVSNFHSWENRISQARVVMRISPPLANAVLAGDELLRNAYEKAKDIEAQMQTTDAVAAKSAKRLEEIKKRASDIAELAADGRLSLDEAEAAIAERERKARALRQGTWDCISNLEKMLFLFSEGKNRDHVLKICAEHHKEIPVEDLPLLLDQWISNLTKLREDLQ